MEFLVVLALATMAAFALRTPLKKAPGVFYLAAVVAVALLLAGSSGLIATWRPIIPLVQRCMVALALFTVVMFIGVFSKESRVGAWLRPVRGELSIIACILCIGHISAYVAPYVQRALSGSMSGSMLASLCIAAVLFALLLVLGATSLSAVKRRMRSSSWRVVQRFAYLFFMLAYAHLALLLAPAALAGGTQAQASIVVYSAVFLAYAALRLYRWVKEGEHERVDCRAADASSLA